MMGVVVLGAATLAYLARLPDSPAPILGLLVAALALLAAATGLCAGCEIYRLGARLRGIGSRHITRIDPADVGGLTDGAVVQFTHPLCSECHRLERDLRDAGPRRRSWWTCAAARSWPESTGSASSPPPSRWTPRARCLPGWHSRATARAVRRTGGQKSPR